MRVRRFVVAALGLAALVGAARPASAGLIVYTNLASFQAATTGLTDVNFNGLVTSGNFLNFPTPPGFTRSGVNFNLNPPSNGGGLNPTAKDYYFVHFGGPTYPQDFLVNGFNPGAVTETEVITLPPGGATAVGLDLGTFGGQSLAFAFSTGDTFLDPGTPGFGQTSFLGFTSSAPITSLSITYSVAGGEAFVIDDVKFGAALAVPEPASLTLLSLGALGLLGYGWRRRKQAA